jgi:hypothetical protein
VRHELDISPESSSEQRAALAAAFDVVLSTEGAVSATEPWWEAGVRANLEDEDDVGQPGPAPPPKAQATARRPRRRFGATRA